MTPAQSMTSAVRLIRSIAILPLAVELLSFAFSAAAEVSSPEPNAKTAYTWWPALRNVWTPVGVRNHPCRFNVLYNGTVLADPHPLRDMGGHPIRSYLAPYADFGV